jgi:signal transduction histidine kinase
MIKRVKSFVYLFRHECALYGLSILGVFIMFPLLYADDNENTESEIALRNAVESKAFEVWMYASFALGIPLSLDVFIDVFAKGRLAKELFARAFICAILMFSSSMQLYNCFSANNYYLAPVIKEMTVVLNSGLMVHQLLIRGRDVISTKYYYFMFFTFQVGTILRAYDQIVPVLFILGRSIRIIGLFSTLYVVLKHIFMVICGNLEQDWFDKWHQTAFEILLLVSLVVSTVISIYYGADDDSFDRSGGALVALSYTNSSYLVLMSAIITNEYRHDYTQLQQKLGVKRMFVRYVSHEVRTPLSSCMLGIEYMKEAILNPTEACIQEITGILDEVSEGCNMAIDFINNLLLYEKVDSMELPIHLKQEDLSLICSQVLKTFEMSARQLEINLHLDIHASLLAPARGCDTKKVPTDAKIAPRSIASSEIDGPKVMIVLRNLTSNALKFTPKGGLVSLSVIPVNICPSDLSRSASDGGGSDRSAVHLPPSSPEDTTHFRVILSDTGRGMSQEEQKQLFTKIIQFSPNEIQQGGGSGIGLFLSHQIMAGHNLKIQVYSEGINNTGTHFFMDFPVSVGLCDADAAPNNMNTDVESNNNNSDGDRTARELCFSCVRKPSTVHDTSESEGGGGSINTQSLEPEDNVLAEGICLPKMAKQSSLGDGLSVQKKGLDELNILIVDDSPLNRKMLIRTLRQHHVGSSFMDVGDGRELLCLLGVPEGSCSGSTSEDDMIVH